MSKFKNITINPSNAFDLINDPIVKSFLIVNSPNISLRNRYPWGFPDMINGVEIFIDDRVEVESKEDEIEILKYILKYKNIQELISQIGLDKNNYDEEM